MPQNLNAQKPCCAEGTIFSQAALVVTREPGYGWLDQPLEVGVADAHRVGVGARPEDYSLVLGERLVDVDGPVVEVAEGGNRTHLAVGERLLELRFFCQVRFLR